MLILSRRMYEVIRIADDIQVILLGVCGQSARIGIQAPDYVSIYREEVYQRIKKEGLRKADQERGLIELP